MPTLLLITTQYHLNTIKLGIAGRNHLFIIDTGAEVTVLSPELCHRLEPANNFLVEGIGGKTQLQSLHVTFNLLGKTIYKVVCSDKLPGGISGIIGQDVLSQFPSVTIDYEHHKIKFGR